MLSSSFLASTLPFSLASSSANFSASLIILSMSSGVSLFWSLVMVIFCKLLSVVDHPLNVLRSESVLVVGDGNLLLGPSTLVLGTHNQDTIGIDLESNLNLRNTSGCWRNSSDVELAQLVVVLGHGSFTLEHLDGDSVLVVGSSGEDLALFGGDNSVPGDKLGHHASNSLDSKGERVDIEKDKISSILFTGEHSGLDSSSISNSFIGVNSLAWLFSIEELFNQRLDLWDPS